MPRARSELGVGLPDNVYFSKSRGRIYYRWRHPVSGQITSLGPDRDAAKRKGMDLNDALKCAYGSAVRAEMRIRGRERNVAFVLERCWGEYLNRRGWSERHLDEVRILRDHYTDRWGRFSLREVSTRALSAQFAQLSPHAQLKHRQFWIHVFRFARAQGLIEDNPAESTLRPSASDLERKRHRLSMEWFSGIRDVADEPLQIAMDVALYSLQRLGDLVEIPKTAVDTEGSIWRLEVHPSKVARFGVHLRITAPTGSALRAALSAAMAYPVPSPYLLARKPARRRGGATKRHWTQWTPDLLSKRFAAARDSSRVCAHLAREERPSFHEIRALGTRLYEEAGFPRSQVQALCGHRSERMTEHYQLGHSMRWTEADAAL